MRPGSIFEAHGRSKFLTRLTNPNSALDYIQFDGVNLTRFLRNHFTAAARIF